MMLKLFKRDESFGAMLEDVLYFKAEGHYTNVFFTRDSKMLLPYGLSQLDNEIWKLDNGTCFVKVGRSHIVNLKKVVYACITKESFTLMDQNGNFTNIVVSRAAIKQLIKALKDGKASKEEKSDSDNNDNGPKQKEGSETAIINNVGTQNDESKNIEDPDEDKKDKNLCIIRKTKRFAIPERAVYFLKTKRTAGGTPPPQNIFDRLTPVFT